MLTLVRTAKLEITYHVKFLVLIELVDKCELGWMRVSLCEPSNSSHEVCFPLCEPSLLLSPKSNNTCSLLLENPVVGGILAYLQVL
jgi:hypothetical protein